MPHLVIEYSEGVEKQVSEEKMMACAHAAAVESGLFGVGDIKVRAYPCSHYLIAGKAAHFVHISIYLLSGRDAPTKKALTTGVVSAFEGLGLNVASLSVDARDMDREVYSKVTR